MPARPEPSSRKSIRKSRHSDHDELKDQLAELVAIHAELVKTVVSQ